MESGTEDAARRELLTALDERDPSAIRAAMVSYADKVQGVRLQAKAYDLVARLNDDKAAELDKLIVEMRQMAMQRRASLEAEAATAALAAKEAAAAAAAAAAVVGGLPTSPTSQNGLCTCCYGTWRASASAQKPVRGRRR